MFVKICGIKRKEDALAAARFGADAVGFLVGQKYPSNDFISAQEASELIKIIPRPVTSIIVTHLNNAEKIFEIVRMAEPKGIQLHGEITITEAQKLRKSFPALKLYKSIHIQDGMNKNDIEKWYGLADAFVADTVNPATGQIGGTGITHDWLLSREICRMSEIPLILAGGLNPGNIGKAIRQVRPFGVDVNSGVKSRNGFKDHRLMKDLIRLAKNTSA